MNTTSSATIVYLGFVTRELNRYIPLTFLALGIIGNVLNLLVFSRPQLRTNSCSLYFIAGSAVNFLSLLVGLITPFLALYNLDPTQQSLVVCRLRFYLRYATITLSTWFILFTSIDRFLSTSRNIQLRSWSSVRLAKRTILLSSLVCFLFPYTQVFFCYSISSKKVCTPSSNLCKSTVDGVLLVFNSGIPPLLMVLFSLLTIRNVKHLQRLHSRERRDMQLVQLMLIQVAILVLLATPITAQKIFSFIRMFSTQDPLNMAIDSLIAQIATEISYISNSVPFYIYSLASKRFRREVGGILLSCMPCLSQRKNQIHPHSMVTRLHQNNTVEMHGRLTISQATKTWSPDSRTRNISLHRPFLVGYCLVKIEGNKPLVKESLWKTTGTDVNSQTVVIEARLPLNRWRWSCLSR